MTNENKRRVHFIGGPADGDVRVVEPCHTYRVPVLEQQPEVHAYNSNCPCCTERLLWPVMCSTATYFIRRVGEKCWVAIHESLA